jgi:hypothetical protein
VGILRRLCFPVTVLTTATENREQEVMLSSPVSLAPPNLRQSRCHEKTALIPVTSPSVSRDLLIEPGSQTNSERIFMCKKYISWKKYLPFLPKSRRLFEVFRKNAFPNSSRLKEYFGGRGLTPSLVY